MKENLTKRQQAILDYIRREVRTRGYPPSVREIGQAVGLSSSSTVHGHLAQLERKGYIRRDPAKPRAIEVTEQEAPMIGKSAMVEVPLLGQIAAGNPILAEENIEEIYTLPMDLVPYNESFMLRVKGDSMTGAGILDRDLVIVKPQRTAQDGEIVVALLENKATVKRFYKEKDAIRLQPENPAYPPLFSRDVQIMGKVVGIFRRLP